MNNSMYEQSCEYFPKKEIIQRKRITMRGMNQEIGQSGSGDSEVGTGKVAEGEVDDDGRSKRTGTVYHHI